MHGGGRRPDRGRGGRVHPPPAAEPVSVEEEKARTIDVVRALAERGLCVSIDTRHAEVARAAVEAGASIVNDVSGFRDPAMVDVARSCDAGLVVVHMQGEPGTMQENPTYDDVVVEVRDYLVGQAALLEQAGVARDRICLDPGPGFGKTPKQTLELVRNLHELVRTGYPVMAALSRKSYIGYAYHIDDRRSATARRRPKRSWRASWGRASCARTMWPRPCRRSRTCGLSCCWGWAATWPWSLAREKSRKQRRRS